MSRYKNRILKNIISSILVVLILFCSFFALVNIAFNFLYIETQVKGFSMLPTINTNTTNPNSEGDTIYINKYCSFSNNDIVVAKVDWYDQFIIKRVVASPGDRIQIKKSNDEYCLYVNDELFYTRKIIGNEEPFPTETNLYYSYYLKFLENENFKNNIETIGNETYIKLNEDEYFLLGDNWGHTTDSMTYGPVKKHEIVGKVELIVDVKNKNPFVTTWHFLKKIFTC